MFLCKIGMATVRQKGLDILAVLAVILLVCLGIVCLRYSTEGAESQIGQKTCEHISARGEALAKQHQKSTHSDQTGEVNQYSRRTFANEVVSVESKSVMDSFVTYRQAPQSDAAQAASDMNDAMDEMLNRSEIPADYAETMVALSRDKSQGDVVRDFAVQHIGLYAETLNMRGKYDANSAKLLAK